MHLGDHLGAAGVGVFGAVGDVVVVVVVPDGLPRGGRGIVEGQWRVVDATLLAPRQSLVRITTGRDAADTAFLDNHKGAITLNDIALTAVVDGNLPLRIQSTN